MSQLGSANRESSASSRSVNVHTMAFTIKSKENNHLAEYLERYVERMNDPRFAIMINGKWGSGKTWFISEMQKQLGQDRFIYVTLNGVASVSEIKEQFFAAVHPWLASKTFKWGMRIAKEATRIGSKVASVGIVDLSAVDLKPDELKEVLSKTASKILIFDDLERSTMPIESILGFINKFVEHNRQKVIILADEGEIPNSAEYKRRREKLIGRTMTFVAEPSLAFETFLLEINNVPCRIALEANRTRIVNLLEKLEFQNLRVLKQALLEYENFFELLPPQAQSHKEYQASCIFSFIALGVACYSGQLDPEKIHGMYQRMLKTEVRAAIRKNKASKIEETVESTSEPNYFAGLFDPREITPDEETLARWFGLGGCPPDMIKTAVDNSPLFKTSCTEDWVSLWHVWSLSDDEFNQMYNQVESKFFAGGYVDEGELKHVSGMLLAYSREGTSEKDLAEIGPRVVRQIREQISTDKINLLILAKDEGPHFEHSYRQLAIQDYGSSEMKIIFQEIDTYRAKNAAQKIKDHANDICAWMVNEPERILEELLYNGIGRSGFRMQPVLHHIPIENFLTAFERMPPFRRFDVAHMLKNRYDAVRVAPELANEGPWLEALIHKGMQRAEALRQPSRGAMKTMVIEGAQNGLAVIKAFQRELATPSGGSTQA